MRGGEGQEDQADIARELILRVASQPRDATVHEMVISSTTEFLRSEEVLERRDESQVSPA